MKNSIDKTGIVISALIPLAGFIWLLFSIQSDGVLYAPITVTILGLAFVVFLIALEFFNHAYEVDIGEKVVVRYRSRTKQHDILSLEYIYFSPTQFRKYWRGQIRSHVKFSDEKYVVQVSHDIAKAINDEYKMKVGQLPPKHPKSSTFR